LDIIENFNLKKPSFRPSKWPRKLKLLKIVNCQNCHKTVLSQLEKVGGHRYPYGSNTPQIISFTLRYANLFYGHCFYCTNFEHKVAYFRDYKRNVQARSAYVATCNIECYKFHNYGHIASDCRSMIDTSIKENIDIRYKKVWIRKQEEQVNKDQVPEIARLAIKQDEANYTEKKKDVRLIHMDISGHPPFPTSSKQFSNIFGNLQFLAVLTYGAIMRA
jgi:hypothetical protein